MATEVNHILLTAENRGDLKAYFHDRYVVTSEDLRSSGRLHQEITDAVELQPFFERDVFWQKRVLRTLEEAYGYATEDYESWKEDCVPELCLYMTMGKGCFAGSLSSARETKAWN